MVGEPAMTGSVSAVPDAGTQTRRRRGQRNAESVRILSPGTTRRGGTPGGSSAPFVVGMCVGVVGCSGGVLLSHDLSVAVPSALEGLASGFGMGPGVSPPL